MIGFGADFVMVDDGGPVMIAVRARHATCRVIHVPRTAIKEVISRP
jgi:hypothetical protein